jgi:RimJ/RimL family protein N-acetyltransferase
MPPGSGAGKSYMITEESFIDFKCPACGEPVSFPQESAGFAQACPNCTQSFIVPDDGSEVGWQIPVPITTARLVLRRLAGHDWKDLLELMADEEFFRYQDGIPLDEDAVLHWLESDAHVKLTTPDQTFFLGIELQEGHKLIGYLSLNFTDAQRRQVMFSIGLNQKFHRQGFGLEAVVALLTFCFEGLRLHRVAAWSDSRNVAGCRLLEKAGLRREGEFVKSRWVHSEWANSIWYALLEEEFRAADKNPPPSA